VLCSIGVQAALHHAAQTVVLGFTHASRSGPLGLPDFSAQQTDIREFIHAFNITIETWLKPRLTVRVETPLFDLDDAEVVKLAQCFRTPLEHTWSCEWGKGKLEVQSSKLEDKAGARRSGGSVRSRRELAEAVGDLGLRQFHALQQRKVVRQRSPHVRMLVPGRTGEVAADFDAAAQERFGLGQTVGGLEQRGQVVEADGDPNVDSRKLLHVVCMSIKNAARLAYDLVSLGRSTPVPESRALHRLVRSIPDYHDVP